MVDQHVEPGQEKKNAGDVSKMVPEKGRKRPFSSKCSLVRQYRGLSFDEHLKTRLSHTIPGEAGRWDSGYSGAQLRRLFRGR